MKTTEDVCNRGLILLAVFLFAAAPLAARGESQVKYTTNAIEICVKKYGKTIAEAFNKGTQLIEEADAQLGQGRLYGNIRMRVLPEKENGMFVVEVYSFPEKGACAVRTDYTPAEVAHH
ncbi:MAG: hypothetical protein D3924_04870 [Candidatus Electrothrix sp. AR4]|nr:hypothetical protein [Candidatus Electrothrix sp. AR4]